MKILHYYKTSIKDTNGGTEQFMHQLILAGQKFGIDAEILSLSRNGEEGCDKSNGYTIHRIPRQFEIASNSFSLKAISKFSELSKNFDIIHYHFPWPFMDITHLITRPFNKTIVTYHSDIIRQKKLLKLYKPLMDWFLNDVDHIVSTSQNYFNTSSTLQNYKAKTSVIPIGLDKSVYDLENNRKIDYWKKKFPNRFFLFVGALRYYKGLHILVEAVKDENWPIVIVGAGPIEREIINLIKKYNLNNIHLLGNLDAEDRDALYHLCYAVVFPSYLRSEAFGITLLEGSLHGKPLISSEIGTGTSYININHETGLVVEPSNPIALKLALKLLWENPEYTAELGRNAAKRYELFFTAEVMVKSYLSVYKNLLS